MFSKKAARQDAMRKTTACYFLLLLCVFAFPSIFITFVEAQTSSGDVDKIKALLLRPSGWVVYISKGPSGESGEAEFLFEEREGNVTVKTINYLTTPKSGDAVARGEFKVTITPDAIKTHSSGEPNLTIHYDPNDRAYPFKGRGGYGYEYKFAPK
jgi:hypothetical protein